ncbi:hypothetical protein TNCV_3771611 [Trichonephila clavipes]|nr:hypothetical protein TNCV_3771611 [Trichonephila clavipes]
MVIPLSSHTIYRTRSTFSSVLEEESHPHVGHLRCLCDFHENSYTTRTQPFFKARFPYTYFRFPSISEGDCSRKTQNVMFLRTAPKTTFPNPANGKFHLSEIICS